MKRMHLFFLLALWPLGLVTASGPGGVWDAVEILDCVPSRAAPKTRDGEINGWWKSAHEARNRAKEKQPNTPLVFIGDSITDNFDAEEIGKAESRYPGGATVWNTWYAPRKAVNVGLSGDAIQNVLWRIEHGALEGIHPKAVVLTIGHNNKEPAQEIAAGMLALLKEIRTRLPDATILFIPHFPTTKSYWSTSKQIRAYNMAVEAVGADPKIVPLDLNDAFVNSEGILKDPDLIPDNVHPSESGYRVWAEAMEPALKKLVPFVSTLP